MSSRWRQACAVALLPIALGYGYACSGGNPQPAPPPTPAFFDLDAAKVAPTVEVRESTPRRWAATVRVPGLGAHAVKEGGATYYALSILGGGTTRLIRRPELPILTYHLVLPHLAGGAPVPAPVVKVTTAETVVADGVDVHPAQRSAFAGYTSDNGRDAPIPFARDDAAYASTDAFPSAPFEMHRVELDGYDVLQLKVFPVRVWPGQHRLELAKRVEIEVDLAPMSDPVEAATTTDATDEKGAIVLAHDAVSPMIDNAESVTVTTYERPPLSAMPAPDVPDDPLYELLVVTAPEFLAQAGTLARHKRDFRGMAVKVVRTDAISGGAELTPEMLRDYLVAEYRGNRPLSEGTDGNEIDVPDADDLRHASFYLHRAASGAALLGADLALFGTGSQASLIVYVDADRDGETDYEIASYPPFKTFTVKRRTAPGSFTELVHTGTPVVRPNGVRYELPWDVLLAGTTVPDRLDVHVVALQQPLDRLPDAGKLTLDRTLPLRHTLRYLLLVGDVEQIPLMTSRSSWEVKGGPAPGETMLKVATDHYYASLDDDIFPEISVGRLPVDTSVEAQHAIDKIIRYETDDPFARMSPRVATVAPFDDGARPDADAGPVWDGTNDTKFVDAVELVRDYFKARGNRATPLYSANVSVTPPARFNDGRPLPGDLAYPAYPWNTGRNELVTLFSAYDSQLIIHVDHGLVTGWGGPPFETSDVARVPAPPSPMVGIYPIVFSLNCASGYIDPERDRRFFADGTSIDFTTEWWTQPTVTSFAEALIHHEGGAVGVVAATRMSSVVYNNDLLAGLVKALYRGYPTYDPAADALGPTERALGKIVDDGKFYTDAVAVVLADEWTDFTLQNYEELYHLFGDPSMRVRRVPAAP